MIHRSFQEECVTVIPEATVRGPAARANIRVAEDRAGDMGINM
jgi:hypothetical protein